MRVNELTQCRVRHGVVLIYRVYVESDDSAGRIVSIYWGRKVHASATWHRSYIFDGKTNIKGRRDVSVRKREGKKESGNWEKGRERKRWSWEGQSHKGDAWMYIYIFCSICSNIIDIWALSNPYLDDERHSVHLWHSAWPWEQLDVDESMDQRDESLNSLLPAWTYMLKANYTWNFSFTTGFNLTHLLTGMRTWCPHCIHLKIA